jgi:hypothetical protein
MCSAELCLLLLLLLLAKGWTIIRHKISASGRVKIAVYMTVLVCGQIGSIIWAENQTERNSATVPDISTSPAGVALVLLRLAAAAWFTYAVYVTLTVYTQKRRFYRKFYVLGMLWLLSYPVMVAISTAVDAVYRRIVLEVVAMIAMASAQVGR